MNINNFLRAPLVKIIVTILFIFYLYEKTKNDPRTVSYQIKKTNFKESVSTIKQAFKDTKNISLENNNNTNLSHENDNSSSSNDFGPLSFNDILIGKKDPKVICGSEITVQYSLLEKDTNQLINQSQITFKIGDGFNKLMEKALIGMKGGGIRIVDIPENFSTGDSNYDNLIKSKKMIYKILLIIVDNSKTNGVVCD